jgi:phage/plasmid-like protein (TIGR03299 family)
MSTIAVPTAPASTIWRGYSSEGATSWADETGIFEGAIPIEKVRDNLFGWHAVEGQASVDVLTEDGVTTYPAPNYKGIVNPTNGRVMGMHSPGYAMHQFDEWLLTKVARMLAGDLTIAGAGTFKHGAVGFVQVEMPETMEVHGVKFRPFINAATSHDGSLSSTYNPGTTLIVCSNQMGSAFGAGVKVRHTANSDTRVIEFDEAFNIVQAEGVAFGETIDRLANITVTDTQWQQFVEAHVGLDRSHLSTRSRSIGERRAGDLNSLWNNNEMVTPFKNTAFGVVQAVSVSRHHFETVRGATRGERNTFSAITGTNTAQDAKALALLERVLAA